MKKLLLLTILLLNILCVSAYAKDISIVINGEVLESDNPPVMVNDRVLVPMRAIFEGLEAEVEWDEETRCANATRAGVAIKVPIGENNMHLGIVNSDDVMIFSVKSYMDVPAQIIDDRTYIPVRAVSESFNLNVTWDGELKTVSVNEIEKGENKIFYSSSDDYGKVFSVDTNGAKRVKISDQSAKEVYYFNGKVYFITYEGYLFECDENGDNEKQITDFDTKLIKADGETVYCIQKKSEEKGNLFEIKNNQRKDFGEVENPTAHRNYIYYNKPGEMTMTALNTDTNAETKVTMGQNSVLSPLNCVFYGDYILVEDGEWYNNIVRFNADGSGRLEINHNTSFICRNQEEDARILYINADSGQDIYYVWIDGSYNGVAVDVPDNCIYADVLAQKGDMIFYKNMYRREIYRTDFDATENIYVAYGDNLKVFDDIMLIENDGLFLADLNGGNLKKLYDRDLVDYFVHNDYVVGKDKGYGNIVKLGENGEQINLSKESVLSWASNI